MRVLVALALLAVLAVPASAKPPPPPTETQIVPTGRAPCGIAARDGNIWVGVYGAGVVLRIDPASGRITRRIRVGRWACRLALDSRAIWVTRDRAGVIVYVDRRTGVRTSYDVGASPFDVLLAKGSVWVSSYDIGTVAQIDALRRRPTRVFRDGPRPAGLAFCGGSIWVGHGTGTTWLTRIDPRSHRVRRADVALDAPTWPRCVREQLWVTTIDSVLQVDPRRGKLVGHYRIGGTLSETAAGPDGLVWVTDKERSRIYRIDARNRRVVDSFAAGPGAFAMARAGQAMWVTSFAGADIRKYVP